jgi:hypothetical protein
VRAAAEHELKLFDPGRDRSQNYAFSRPTFHQVTTADGIAVQPFFIALSRLTGRQDAHSKALNIETPLFYFNRSTDPLPIAHQTHDSSSSSSSCPF